MPTAPGPNPTDVLLATGLPAIPGGIWSLLAKLAWSDPTLVRSFGIPFEADLLSGPAIIGVSSDGPVTQVPAVRTPGKMYFLVRRIEGFVEVDPGAVTPEGENSIYTTLQIEDESHKYELFDSAIRMAILAGSITTDPTPLLFDEIPLVFVPDSNIIVTFQPLAGFANAVSSVSGLTTRHVGVNMHGALIDQNLVDRLLDLNADVLRSAGLLKPR